MGKRSTDTVVDGNFFKKIFLPQLKINVALSVEELEKYLEKFKTSEDVVSDEPVESLKSNEPVESFGLDFYFLSNGEHLPDLINVFKTYRSKIIETITEAYKKFHAERKVAFTSMLRREIQDLEIKVTNPKLQYYRQKKKMLIQDIMNDIKKVASSQVSTASSAVRLRF